MRIFVQLGWIQDIINWIFDKILNPIFKWVTDLLSDVFKWLFDNVLGPILEVVFTIVMERSASSSCASWGGICISSKRVCL